MFMYVYGLFCVCVGVCVYAIGSTGDSSSIKQRNNGTLLRNWFDYLIV